MKKEYITPEVRVEEFDLKDIIMTTSGSSPGTGSKGVRVSSYQATISFDLNQ